MHTMQAEALTSGTQTGDSATSEDCGTSTATDIMQTTPLYNDTQNTCCMFTGVTVAHALQQTLKVKRKVK